MTNRSQTIIVFIAFVSIGSEITHNSVNRRNESLSDFFSHCHIPTQSLYNTKVHQVKHILNTAQLFQ